MKTKSKLSPYILRGSTTALLFLFALFSTTPTRATPIVGGQIFVQNTGDVIATFVGSEAAYDDLLLLASPPNNLGVIFEGHVSPHGSMLDLGIFSAGTELIFELNNQNGRFFYWPSQPQLRQHCSRDCGLSVGAWPNFRGIRGYFRRW